MGSESPGIGIEYTCQRTEALDQGSGKGLYIPAWYCRHQEVFDDLVIRERFGPAVDQSLS